MKKERTMKKINKPFYKKWWFILIAVIVVISIVSSIKEGIKNSSDKGAAYIWPDSALVSLIPQPDSKYGKINMENEDYFSIDIYKVSKESFEKYVEDCKNSGFTADYMKTDNYYSADSKEGHSLHLSYDEKEKTLMIMLSTPAENSGQGNTSPEKDSPEKDSPEKDSPEKDSPKQEEKNASVTEQKEIEDGDNSIEAKDSEDSSETAETEDAAEINQPAVEASGDIRPEFKEVLDEYEAFMNGYCDFMKKYANSDDVLVMAADYTKLLQEEVEWLEKIDNLGNEEMNEAETKYYAEVTLRVSQKLLEAAQ